MFSTACIALTIVQTPTINLFLYLLEIIWVQHYREKNLAVTAQFNHNTLLRETSVEHMVSGSAEQRISFTFNTIEEIIFAGCGLTKANTRAAGQPDCDDTGFLFGRNQRGLILNFPSLLSSTVTCTTSLDYWPSLSSQQLHKCSNICDWECGLHCACLTRNFLLALWAF